MDMAAQQDMNQFLTFTLGREIYALDINTVREVLELTTVTRIPGTPEFMRGVINLRGHAVPVVDMRLKLNMARAQDTVNTCIIIVEISYAQSPTIMGALVDSVREVIEIQPSGIEPAPRMGDGLRPEFIRGMGRLDNDFVIILDIDKVFSTEELARARAAVQDQEPVAAA
ncbi:MAG: chemotaxis protein CheW [Desulfovibrionaceae bacterium]|nr:chemotaxis protein CheW [Desulfovibrionaceae bacterium]